MCLNFLVAYKARTSFINDTQLKGSGYGYCPARLPTSGCADSCGLHRIRRRSPDRNVAVALLLSLCYLRQFLATWKQDIHKYNVEIKKMVWYTSHVIQLIQLVYDVTPDANIETNEKYVWLAIWFSRSMKNYQFIHSNSQEIWRAKKELARDSSGDSFCSSIERPAPAVGELGFHSTHNNAFM